MVQRQRLLFKILALLVVVMSGVGAFAQTSKYQRSTIRGGMLAPAPTAVDTLLHDVKTLAADSVALDSLVVDSLKKEAAQILGIDSLALNALAADSLVIDSLAKRAHHATMYDANLVMAKDEKPAEKVKKPGRFFSDSVSLSTMAWTAAVLPGYGQIYNKQYYKLPIIYGAMALSTGLFIYENRRYQPLKEEYDALTLTGFNNRTDELDDLQAEMIHSNTRRQFYLGGMVASYVYSMVDATVKYSTNEVSSVKKATTLAMICPGAGQVFNKSYWKVPFVVGGFATMIYCIDWNSRGYNRFKKAYALAYDFEQNEEAYLEQGIEQSQDEFGGRYSASYLKSIRNSYRRNRDLCLIMTGGLYILQVIDAHVDAHLRDYDISDDLTMNIDPMIQNGYSPTKRSNFISYGFNVNVTF